ncbi:MAG: hypothetical protein MUE52_05680 [Tabrizicola sp.]|nr:hypothetical protein [Tabrizicola sp.]
MESRDRMSLVSCATPGSRLATLLLTSALASLPMQAVGQTITWDGDTATPGLQSGDWNEVDGPPFRWVQGSSNRNFDPGDDVEFDEELLTSAVTVTLTQNVAPGSITFESDLLASTAYTISGGTGFSIESSEGDFGGNGSDVLLIRMNNAATINAGLIGDFHIEGTQTLTLGGISNSLDEITVDDDLQLIVTNTAVLSGIIDLNDGSLVINGEVEDVEASSGTTTDLNVGGRITGTLTNFGTATIAGNVEGIEHRGGSMTFDGSMTVGADGLQIFGGGTTATIVGGVTVFADTSVFGGLLTINSTATLNGDVDVSSSGDLNIQGDVIGTVTSGGDVTLAGTVTGDFINQTSVARDGVLTMTGEITGTLTNDGRATVAGTLGALDNNSGGEVTINGATTISGTVDNDGDITINGATTVTGAATNEGNLTVNSATTFSGTLGNLGEIDFNAATSVTGVLDNSTSDGDITVGTGVTLTATSGILNRGGASLEVLANGSIIGQISNDGSSVVTLRNGSSTTGGFTNTGTLVVDGAVSVASLDSSGTIDMSDGATGDVLTLTGATTLNGRVEMDINLNGPTGSSDLITTTSAITGNVVLDFNRVGATFSPLENPIVVLSYGGTGLNATAEGLISVGAVIYDLDTSVAGQVRVISFANPGVGAVAGSVTLTQSLIGSVINRPSSPFVTGLAGESDRPCRPGIWARALGGRATADGQTTAVDTLGNSRDYSSLVEASYSGIQLGGDLSCFDNPVLGWDMSFGGILGVNSGSTQQPVFAVASGGTTLPDVVVSNNTTDFQQGYAGVYVSAVKDRLLLDLQYRVEQTSFDLRNDGVGAGRIGIIDQEFKSKGQTLSGSVSYVFPISEANRINFVPTAGFAFTKYKTDSLAFADNGRVDIDDGEIKVGFVGGALSMTRILPSGNAALTYFATGTYYKDFADPLRSVYTGGTAAASTAEIFSSNLGEYGEASLGFNYTQILDPGNPILNAKQLNASVRLDGRFGESLDSWGITAQMRLQF